MPVTDKAVLLDLDGTLADSIVALKEVYFSFLSRYGARGSDAEFGRLNGPPLVTIIAVLKDVHHLPGDASRLQQEYAAMVREAHRSAPPATGARQLLREAKGHGWKVAVVTSSARCAAWEWLSGNRLLSSVDVIVGGDEVACGKPAPDPYALALSRLGSPAGACLAVEDSRLGALSALAAGLPTHVLADQCDRTGWPAQVVFIERLTDLLELLRAC
jgi:HAD superfamily hydrolase (TIGR01509 family)